MSKFSPYALTERERKKLIEQFYYAVTSFKKPIELKNFINDLLSESELVMLARRLEIAKMLLHGVGYQKIRASLKVGFDNINAVNCWLRYGREGYIKAVKNVEKFEKKKLKIKDRKTKRSPAFNWYEVKKSYPAQFWPKELLDKLDTIVDDYSKKEKSKPLKEKNR